MLVAYACGTLFVLCTYKLQANWNMDFRGGYIELRWQRRSYDLGVYFNPYEGVGGVRFRLNDFDFDGSGVPFVPYRPSGGLPGEPINVDRPL